MRHGSTAGCASYCTASRRLLRGLGAIGAAGIADLLHDSETQLNSIIFSLRNMLGADEVRALSHQSSAAGKRIAEKADAVSRFIASTLDISQQFAQRALHYGVPQAAAAAPELTFF